MSYSETSKLSTFNGTAALWAPSVEIMTSNGDIKITGLVGTASTNNSWSVNDNGISITIASGCGFVFEWEW